MVIFLFSSKQERSKALGYMTSNALSGVNEEKSSQVNSGINELKITIDRCHKLKSTSSMYEFSLCLK